MKQSDNFRYLAIRAAVVVAAVLLILLVLRRTGVLASQWDLPVQNVEQALDLVPSSAE